MTRVLRRWSAALACAFAPAACLFAPAAAALDVSSTENVEVSTERMVVDLRRREVLLIRPREPANEPAPLVVMLHFLNGLHVEMANLSGAAALVRDTGAWVALPLAINGRWNTPQSITVAKLSSDVRFLETMIDELAARHPVDTSRVYMTGYSNGAMMTEYFACQRPQRLAAFGLVGSTTLRSRLPPCAPQRSVPLVMVHGTEDTVVPYDGNLARFSAPETAQRWADLAGCAGAPARTDLPQRIDDGTSVFVERYTDCAEGGVEFFTVTGGGHTWPGALGFSPDLGRVSQNLSATAAMWNFFQQFSRPQE